jgi:glycosyltransferase involved in cell wall biosynthesis
MPGRNFNRYESLDSSVRRALVSGSDGVDRNATNGDGRPQRDRRGHQASADPSVAVLLPCRNEERDIGTVVGDFLSALPGATVYVYDNASNDGTAAAALAAGAIVRYAPLRGKGRVIRQMFAEVEAAIFVVADGDDTYDARSAPAMIAKLRQHQLDMVIGTRVTPPGDGSTYRRGHRLGNWLLSRSVTWAFGAGSTDMLSGYRVLSRRYVKSFPALSTGFEIETEMTVHALDLGLSFEEVPTTYRERRDQSASKLRTVPDGARILRLILGLCKDYRPIRFFGLTALAAATVAVILGLLDFGYLHAWTPWTFFMVALGAVAVLSMLAGIVLDSLRRNSREMKRMLYLATDPTHGPAHDRRRGAAYIPGMLADSDA